MNIYDFDETIYDGDSTRDFYFYCLKRFPKMLFSVPAMVWMFFLYILGAKTKTQFKEKMYGFLRYVPDIDETIGNFWEDHIKNIKPWYKEKQKGDDVIISASPEFLLKTACKKLGIKYLIASRVDKRTGVYTGENCHGEEKVRRLNEEMPGALCDEFYSDSLSDTPLAKISKRAWIIRGDELTEWEKYKARKR